MIYISLCVQYHFEVKKNYTILNKEAHTLRKVLLFFVQALENRRYIFSHFLRSLSFNCILLDIAVENAVTFCSDVHLTIFESFLATLVFECIIHS